VLDDTGADRADHSMVYEPDGRLPAADQPLPASPGPHLLLDECLIAESRGVQRVVRQPTRDAAIPNPIVTGREDRCFQPFFSVLRDPSTGRYRLWYGRSLEDQPTNRSRLAFMDSEDGIHFIRPHRICDTPEIRFGSNVLDRGEAHPDPSSRYVYSYWMEDQTGPPLIGGTRLLVSADGVAWRPFSDGPVLRHNHDITGIAWDPIRRVYTLTMSVYIESERWPGRRRTTTMSFSKDLREWEPPWFVLAADAGRDEGRTEFYAMDGYLTRGGLRIAMVKVLRDDLVAAGAEQGSFGRAHTSLAWSRDGRTWIRDRARFFEPDDDPAAWDHAHAWIDKQLIDGDTVRLYYGGYKQGHKANRFTERCLGLVQMPLDRYVARRATGATGMIKTVPFRLDAAGGLFVNADAARGRLRAQARDVGGGEVVPGMSFADCEAVSADALRQPVRWRRAALADTAGRPVQLEFELTNADLFAFEFAERVPRVR